MSNKRKFRGCKTFVIAMEDVKDRYITVNLEVKATNSDESPRVMQSTKNADVPRSINSDPQLDWIKDGEEVWASLDNGEPFKLTILSEDDFLAPVNSGKRKKLPSATEVNAMLSEAAEAGASAREMRILQNMTDCILSREEPDQTAIIQTETLVNAEVERPNETDEILYLAAISQNQIQVEKLLEGQDAHCLFKLYFVKYPFGTQVPVMFFLSTLPPKDRVIILEEVVSHDPKNLEAYNKLGLAYLKSGRRREAHNVVYPVLCTTGKVSVLVNQAACL